MPARFSSILSDRRDSPSFRFTDLVGISIVALVASEPALAIPQGMAPALVGLSSTGDVSQTLARPSYSTVGETVQQRISWVYDLAEDGARGDAVSDTAALQRALAYANLHPGTVIRFPAGTWALTSPGSTGFDIPSNTVLEGASRAGTVVTWNDTDGDKANAAFALFGGYGHPARVNVVLRDFTIVGSEDQMNPATGREYGEASQGGYPILFSGVNGLTIENMRVEHSRMFSIAASYDSDVIATGNLVQYSSRDGISIVGSPNVTITNNVVEHGGDDAIAAHSATGEAWGVRRDIIITGNRIFDAQGISVSSARSLEVAGNIIDNVRTGGITVGTAAASGSTSGGGEAFANVLDVDISGNTITNVTNRQAFDQRNSGSDYIEIIGQSARSGTYTGIPGLPGTDGVVHQPYFEMLANSGTTSTPTPASGHILISGNVLSRQIPPTDGTDGRFRTWTDLGFGPAFMPSVGSMSPSVGVANMQGVGVHIWGGALQQVQIQNNSFNGLYWPLLLGSAVDLGTILFQDNTVFDVGQSAVYLQSLGSTKGQLILDNNLFDLDPYQTGYGRSTHGTWSNPYGPAIIFDNNTTPPDFSVVMTSNRLRNAAAVSNESTLSPPTGWVELGNIAQAQPATVGFSTANKGIAVIPQGGWMVHVTDSDPSSPTYGQILQAYSGVTQGMPTAGTWVQGDYLRDVTVGGAVAGWVRETTGNGNALYSDWVPVPAMAGGRLPLDPAGTTWIQEVAGTVVIGTGSTRLFSIDGQGNVLAKGTITANSSP